jgi:hypothetical protein
MNKVFLAVLIIAMAVSSVVAFSFVPNPLVKNRPWINIDDVSISILTDYQGSTVADFSLVIGIHNPTHQTIRMEDINPYVNGKITVTTFSDTVERYLEGNLLDSQILSNGNWITLPIQGAAGSSAELSPCSPTQIGFEFESSLVELPSMTSVITSGTFHFTITFTINGSKTSLTNDISTNFVTTPTQATTSTSTTATESYKPTNECLFPWV